MSSKFEIGGSDAKYKLKAAIAAKNADKTIMEK